MFADNDTSPLQLRLVGGNNEQEGRIEILYYGSWGTVCDQLFNFNSANVACRRLGFPGALSIRTNISFSLTAPVWMGNVQCTGDESGLEQCSHGGFGNFYGIRCRLPASDVGVMCIGMYVVTHACICYIYLRINLSVIYNYRMVGNFRGVQIFVDFVRSACPQKFTEF